MMTEDEYMDVLALRRQGLTIVEIAEQTGYHPATISKWLQGGVRRRGAPRRHRR